MVKHIVLFKTIEFESVEKRMECLTEIKVALEGLPQEIDVLRSMEVGINANPAEAWDFSLIAVVGSMEEVEQYSLHPAHLRVAKLIGKIKKDRACVDYFFR